MKTHLNSKAYIQQHNPILVRKKTTQEKNNKITTTNTITNTHRPAQAISFSGSINSIGNKALNNFVNSKKINNLIYKVNDNEAAFNAIYALIVAGMLKPIAVMHMPGSEDKDKQIVATKNFIQAFLGFFLSYTIGGGFIKKTVDTIQNDLKLLILNKDNNQIETLNPESKEALELAKAKLKKEHDSFSEKFKNFKNEAKEKEGLEKFTALKKCFSKSKYEPSLDEIEIKAKRIIRDFEQNRKNIFLSNPTFTQELISKAKNLKSETEFVDAFEVFWKNSTGALTSICKAKISSILLPTVMAFLFAKKNLEKEQKELREKQLEEYKKNANCMLNNNSNFKQEEEKFHNFLNSKNSSNPSFSGSILNSAIDTTAKGMEFISMSKPGEKLIKFLSKSKKPSARMADFESVAITTYWLQNTARSKKIEPSQKLGLNLHTALVTLVSSTCAFIIDFALDGLIKKAKDCYKNAITTALNETKEIHKDLINIPLEEQKETAPIIEMAIRDAYKNITKENKNIDESTYSEVLDSLKNSKAIQKAIKKGALLDLDLIKTTFNNLKKTEPIKDTLMEKCKNLLGCKEIAEKLSSINLKDIDKINDAIESLGEKTYGKKLNKFKSLTIFTLVVRFLVPVLLVPISGKLKKKIMELKNQKDDD